MKQRSSDQTSTSYSNNNNSPIATTNVASTPLSAGPSHNLNKTTSGWFSQWTGAGYGHHGPRGLHQQSPNTSSRHQHLQSAQKGPNQPTQKQAHLHPQGHQTHRRPQDQQIQATISHQHSPPKFYGLSKIHKVGTPLRPILSSRWPITYGVAKELAYIIKPLVGQSPHHLKNTQHFVQQLQGKKVGTRGGHHLL